MKNELTISDSNHILEGYKFDFFYPNPYECQELCKDLCSRELGREVDFYTLDGLFSTTINRYFLSDIKILEHPLILNNIVEFLKKNAILKVTLLVNPNNGKMAQFYSKALLNEGFSVVINYHDKEDYWRNSLTNSLNSLKTNINNIFTVFGQLFLLLVNFFSFKSRVFFTKKVVIWYSFANNRQKIDYKFLDNLSSNNHISVIYPNPTSYKDGKSSWDKSIYFFGSYTISPYLFCKALLSMVMFKRRFNKLLKNRYSQDLKYIPIDWNAQVLQKTFFFLIYNLLTGGLIESLAKDKSIKVVNIFRGGSAAGLIYSGICKTKLDANHTNILVPHGTEYNPIDHYSYFYLDYNILPSKLIVENWNLILNKDERFVSKYNNCTLLDGGRIDYELLDKVNITKLVKDKIIIGIVLTYNTKIYQDQYIGDIVELFSSKFGKANCSFLIKPRPNIIFEAGEYMNQGASVEIYENDIYNFLEDVNCIVGTVSTYGILTMVVTDAIYLSVPAFYYIPNSLFTTSLLGYSYHSTMENFTFTSKTQLGEFINNSNDVEDFCSKMISINLNTKSFLHSKERPSDFLFNLITY